VVESVIPAVWPALVVGGLQAQLMRHISSGTLLAVALQAIAGGVVYLALFFVIAINRHDRAYYVAKVMELTRKGPLVPAGNL
jgi:hypothetical protein